MIYAGIDVDLQGHPRAQRAGPAMYLWTYAMLWMRQHKGDGFVPTDTALGCLWGGPVGQRCAMNKRASARLVEVGLWVVVEGGWMIFNYLVKNDSPEVIEARISASQAKQQAYRERKKLERVRLNVTGNEAGNVPVPSGAGAGALSLGSRDQEKPQPASGSAPDIESPPDWAAGPLESLRMATGAPLVLADEWAAFCLHGKPRTPIDWRKWISNAISRARAERERRRDFEAQSGARLKAAAEARANAGYSPPPPLITAEQDREYLAEVARRDATAPEELVAPVAGILAMLEGRQVAQ